MVEVRIMVEMMEDTVVVEEVIERETLLATTIVEDMITALEDMITVVGDILAAAMAGAEEVRMDDLEAMMVQPTIAGRLLSPVEEAEATVVEVEGTAAMGADMLLAPTPRVTTETRDPTHVWRRNSSIQSLKPLELTLTSTMIFQWK